VTFGDLDVQPLSDGTMRLDGGAMFGVVPRSLWERRATPDAKNRIRLALRPLLIRRPGHVVLVDTGVGDKLDRKFTDLFGLDRSRHLDHALAGVGLTAVDVDIVILTHLHFDHAGGATARVGDTLVPRFPRARYVVRRGEWEDARSPDERSRASYLPDNFLPLADAGVLDLVDHDAEIVPGVRLRRTGGHTAHHQMVQISGGGRTAVFAADLLPTVAHLDLPWIMSYDLYPLDTLAYKRKFLAEAVEGEYAIFFEHDPDIAGGLIRVDGRHYRVDPLEI